MKDPPYIFACFSKLKDKKSRQKHMADPLKCKNVLLNMCFKFYFLQRQKNIIDVSKSWS